MRDISSCFSDRTLNFSHPSSCSSNPTATTISSSGNLTPSTPIAVNSLYRVFLPPTIRTHLLIAVTWSQTQMGLNLRLDFGPNPSSSSASFFKLNTNSRLSQKKRKGAKTLTFDGSKIEILYDLSSARYNLGPEPSAGFYVLVLVDSKLGLALGDLVGKRVRPGAPVARVSLISRREHVLGWNFFMTRARFSDSGAEHEILIQCSGEEEREKHRVLSIWVDRKSLICVKRLEWNFRGNQTVFVDGSVVDMMWDVHDWFFDSGREGPESESKSGSRSGVFMFKTRKGSECSRLWWEEEVKEEKQGEREEEKSEFCLFIHACKSLSIHGNISI